MSPIKRFIHDFKTPPEATKSISVTPAKPKVARVQTPEQAGQTFSIGLARQGSTGTRASIKR